MAIRIALYVGSFDPFTLGHLEIVQRGLRMFDHVYIGVAHNPAKKCMFNMKERLSLIGAALEDAGLQEVCTVAPVTGLTVHAAQRAGACALIRGIRGTADLEYESQMAIANTMLAPDIETVFLLPSANKAFVSSSLVREVAMLGGDVSSLVPECVLQALMQKVAQPPGW